MAKLIDVFAVYETSDEYGRRSALVGYYTSKDGAKMAAKGRGWYGSEGAIESARALEVDGKWYALKESEPIMLDTDLQELKRRRRAQALAKLTPEDMRELGIKP